MPGIAVLITLSIAGIANAGHLLWQHRKPGPLICPFNHDCSSVTESKWGNILGIRNEFFGVAFYVSLIVGGLGIFYLPEFSDLLVILVRIAASGAVGYSVFLTLVQIVKIKNYCFYCILSAIVNLLLFLTAVFFISS